PALAAGGSQLWTILLGRSALREPAQIAAELNKHWQRLLEGLSYYKPPSTTSAEKIKADKDVAAPLKELGLRVSKFLGLDEEQSVQLLQSYLQEDYRGTRDSLKVRSSHLCSIDSTSFLNNNCFLMQMVTCES
uniref:NU188 protein n=1 Tax=Junco hyemalis TaxID=40217 RepID=A0A8C5IZ53_JUNHY